MTNRESDKFIENCRYLGLKKLPLNYQSVIEKAGKSNMGFYRFIEDIIQMEADDKKERGIKYRLKASRLPWPHKLLQDFNFSFQPNLMKIKKLIMDLSTMDFLKTRSSILMYGDCGTGKSHLAQSLGMIACEKGIKVYYTTCADMLNDLNIGVYEKTLVKRMRKYVNPQLLVIDEMGHDRLELEVTREAHLLFKVIDERYKQNKSMIFTTNVEKEDWGDYLGDPISTTAILDRIYHHAVQVEVRGPSYREYEGKLLQQKYQDQTED
jgi:DNA replication protein DnaC